MMTLDRRAIKIIELCDDVSLDMLLTLQNPIFSKLSGEEKKRLQGIAANIGADYFLRYFNKENTLKLELGRLGVSRVISFEEDGEINSTSRAYYNPATKIISINNAAMDDSYHLIAEYGLPIYCRESMKKIHILHELFHHIEEHWAEPVDEVMARRLGCRVNPAFRDIAAFKFVNKATGLPPCQLIDFLWLCRYAPAALNHIYSVFREEFTSNTRPLL